MSDAMNSHATAIKQAARDLAQGNIWATDRHIETIDHHADDLATELDEANARAEKLRIERDALRDAGLVDMRRYARAVELKWWNEVNDRANGHPDTENLVEDLRAAYGVAGLMDADLDAAPGDTEGG